jgi:site-specific DNA recombinase
VGTAEVGGSIDPDNEAHDLVMSVFGGMSKGERNRVKVRVRTAMASQTQLEGRYLGGRPPYGYTLKDLGPHPNPAKAADGKRLRGLIPDSQSAPVVRRIFAMYLAGYGMFAIAESLTRDDIPCPSAYDRARNRHRDGLAWSKTAVRTILINPRYTGRQVWNKQRTDEVLLDVNDVALGHTPVMRWNQRDRWVTSNELVHEPLIEQADFDPTKTCLACGLAPPPRRNGRTDPATPTSSRAWSTAASAAGRCKASTPTASPTTAAAFRRSMPWPTRSGVLRGFRTGDLI